MYLFLTLLFWTCIALGVLVVFWLIHAIVRAERDEWWDR